MRRRTSRSRPHVGKRFELARYEVGGGERILHGQPIGKIVRVTDRPACGLGRSYLVERCLAADGFGAVQALVDDYLNQAARTDEIPMLGRPAESTGQVELARYTFCGGVRILCGQKVKGALWVTDRPAAGVGRAYLVENDIGGDGYPALEALLSDYTLQAEKRDEIPMAAGHL
jgi:hypothetical protein